MKRANGLVVGVLLGVVAAGCSAASGDAEPGQELETEVAQSTLGRSSNALTNQQASTVLKLVDDICGDSWCEGEHNFHFDQIQCQRACGSTPGTCRLAFRMFPQDSDLETGPVYARSCKTPGFTAFASLVDTVPNGAQSLNRDYYDALSACIDELERQLPPS